MTASAGGISHGSVGRFVHEWSGDIVVYTLKDGEESEADIGRFRAFYLDVDGAIFEHESIFDVFDSRHETIGYFEQLYDFEDLTLLPHVVKLACGEDDVFSQNLLILDRLSISAAWRGRSLGLVALRGLMQILRPGAGLVAMKPFPLQYEAASSDAELVQLDAGPLDLKH